MSIFHFRLKWLQRSSTSFLEFCNITAISFKFLSSHHLVIYFGVLRSTCWCLFIRRDNSCRYVNETTHRRTTRGTRFSRFNEPLPFLLCPLRSIICLHSCFCTSLLGAQYDFWLPFLLWALVPTPTPLLTCVRRLWHSLPFLNKAHFHSIHQPLCLLTFYQDAPSLNHLLFSVDEIIMTDVQGLS